MKKEKLKKEKNPEPFWNDLVELYFSFCEEKFNDRPTFDGSSPRDLNQIIVSIRKRAELKNIDWNIESAKKRVRAFFDLAFQDDFLSKNFILSSINRQKDKIFFKASSIYNGQQSITEGSGKSGTSSARINALKNW